MTIIQQLINAGIPVIIERSDEATGAYVFEKMTPEQEQIRNDIISPPSKDELRLREYRNIYNSDQFQEAIFEYLLENKTEKLYKLQEERLKVKDRIK